MGNVVIIDNSIDKESIKIVNKGTYSYVVTTRPQTEDELYYAEKKLVIRNILNSGSPLPPEAFKDKLEMLEKTVIVSTPPFPTSTTDTKEGGFMGTLVAIVMAIFCGIVLFISKLVLGKTS